MKKIIALLLCCICIVLSGCSVEFKGPRKSISDFNGVWRQVNSTSEDMYQEAVIDGDTITIHWVYNEGDTRAIYWDGSFDRPTEYVKEYSWTSHAYEGTFGILLSQDETKAFKYEDGQITYMMQIYGTTTTVRLERVDD
jgi:hypothetical protein